MTTQPAPPEAPAWAVKAAQDFLRNVISIELACIPRMIDAPTSVHVRALFEEPLAAIIARHANAADIYGAAKSGLAAHAREACPPPAAARDGVEDDLGTTESVVAKLRSQLRYADMGKAKLRIEVAQLKRALADQMAVKRSVGTGDSIASAARLPRNVSGNEKEKNL